MPKTAEAPFALADRNDLVPLCPHCNAELNEVYRKGRGFPVAQGRTSSKAVAFLAVSVRYRRVVLTNVDATEDVELRPLGLVLKAGEWVLVAEDDGKRRAIAVSRLHGFRSTGARFPYPEDFNLASSWDEISTDGLDR